MCYKSVSNLSVSNPAVASEYAKLAAIALEALGGRVIVAAKPAKTHEAGVDHLVVVVEFEKLEKPAILRGSALPSSPGSGQSCESLLRSLGDSIDYGV